MLNNRSIPNSVVIPELAYPDVREAAAWLCRVFGFRKRLMIANHRAQLSIGSSGAMVVTEATPNSDLGARHSVMIRVENADEHHANAARAGAQILRVPTDYPFGERQYTARDFAGHIWTFTQSIADIDPARWGGELVESG